MTYYLLNLLRKLTPSHGINVFPSNRILWANKSGLNPHSFNRVSFHHESKALPPQPSTCTACEGFKTPLHKSPVVFRNSVPAEFIVLSLVFWVSSFVSRQSSPSTIEETNATGKSNRFYGILFQ